METHRLFGKQIKFNESYLRAVYLKEEIAHRTYEHMGLNSVEVKHTINGVKYVHSYRKLIFDQHENKCGIIIGQTKKVEGWYSPGYGGDSQFGYEDAEPPMFEPKKTYRFWVVATDMNETFLVEKDLFI